MEQRGLSMFDGMEMKCPECERTIVIDLDMQRTTEITCPCGKVSCIGPKTAEVHDPSVARRLIPRT